MGWLWIFPQKGFILLIPSWTLLTFAITMEQAASKSLQIITIFFTRILYPSLKTKSTGPIDNLIVF